MSEAIDVSQCLQNCQKKFDLTMECFGDLVKYVLHQNEEEKKMEVLTFIHNSNKTLQNFTKKLFEEPEKESHKHKKSFETPDPPDPEQVPEKKMKLSPSPLMGLPNEIWMKILGYLPTYDILKNFNLTCKQFHSLAINRSAIKSLQLKLEKAKDRVQYQEIVKVLKRSKTLNKFIVHGNGPVNHILSHALKSNHLKILEVSSREATLSKKNLEYMKNSSIEVLKLSHINLNDDAIQKIGALKTLKSVKILTPSDPRSVNMSELVKTFIDAKIGLEDFAIVSSFVEIKASTLCNFLKDRKETLKKLKICCNLIGTDKEGIMKWNAPSNLEELYFLDHGSVYARHRLKIEFCLEMPKLIKLALRNIDKDMLNMFGTQNFPVLERLYLGKGYRDEDDNDDDFRASQQTIFNILGNCPNLKSVKLVNLEVSDPQPVDTWCAFLYQIYKTHNVYIDILGTSQWSSWNKSPLEAFEKYLKKTDLATFYKYTKIKANYFDWIKEQLPHEW